MKTYFKHLLLLIVVFGVQNLWAQKQTKSLDNSVLWEVSGKGLAKPSYLFGTIHMICSADFYMSDQAKKAFGKTDKLILEIDMSDPTQMAAMQKMAMGDKPLSEALT